MFTIYEDAEYQKILNLFSRYAHTKSQTIDAVRDTVIPMISKHRAFLDIGAGTGYITEKIQPFFQRTIVIEPKKDFADDLQGRFDEVHVCEFKKAKLSERFDFILCRQVLYHVSIAEWESFITKMKSLLDTGGLAMIVLGASRGRYYDFCRTLNPLYRTSKELLMILEDHKMDFFVEKKQAYYYPDSLEDMYSLCRFSVLEGCLTREIYPFLSSQEKEEIDKKILEFARQCAISNNKYELFFERDFIYFR